MSEILSKLWNYKSDKNNDKQYDDIVQQYIWMVRPCVDYKAEESECKAIKGRFHQYFIYGELLDCSNWTQDSKNCPLCLVDKNNDACKSIIKNETERRIKRISDAKKNDVWKKRDEPPADWNGPLPEFFLQRNKQSVFKEKLHEFKEYVSQNEPNKNSECTIL